MKPKLIHNFYKSDKWQLAREIKLLSTKGKCERCGKLGKEVHHKIHLTIKNINDSNVTLNQDNLELLCNDCHNKEHKRFSKVAQQKFDKEGNLVSSES